MKLNLSEASRMTGKTVRQLRYLIQTGRLPAVRDGHRLCLQINRNKAHIRPCGLPHTYLGYRVSRQGFDLGPKARRRFRKKLKSSQNDKLHDLERSLVSWRSAWLL